MSKQTNYIINRAVLVTILTAISLTLTNCNQRLQGLANPNQVQQPNIKDLTANMGALSIRETPTQEIDELPELEFNESLNVPVIVNYDATPEAEAIFYQMSDWTLPPLPIGYKWQRDENNRLLLLKYHLAPDHDIKIVIYGPDINKRINFLALIDNRVYQSFTWTRPSKDPFMDHGSVERRRYPITLEDFHVHDYYLLGGRIYREEEPVMKCMRGHCNDKHDTMAIGRNLPLGIGPKKITPIPVSEIKTVEGRYYSTFDKRNYLPEPESGWGEKLRNHYVKSIRKSNGYYIQYPYYSLLPRLTNNGTAVPDGVTFVGVKSPSYADIFDVPWDHSYPEGKLELDYLFDNFRDTYIPTPLLYRKNRSPYETLTHVNTLVAEANSYLTTRKTFHRPYEKMLSRLSQAGELEFFNPSNKIELALGYSEYVVKPFESNFWLKRVERQACFLDKEIGDKRVIFSDREFADIIVSFREESPGFEDPYDQKLDSIQQVYHNQQDRIKH